MLQESILIKAFLLIEINENYRLLRWILVLFNLLSSWVLRIDMYIFII